MPKNTLSVLVENKPGVLARIAALFSRRGFNIDSLAVGPTEHPDVSRMTVVVDVEVTAGTLTTEGVPYLGKVRLTAGSAVLKDVAEASDVLAQAGQVTLEGTITSGRSRLRCESGSVTIQLGEGSSVVVHGESQLGRIAWTGAHEDGLDEVVLGSGAARLDLSVVMGYATVKLPDTLAHDEDLR